MPGGGMAEFGTASRAYTAWLIAGIVILSLFLVYEYYLLIQDAKRYAYYAIVIERQLVTFVITGGALFAAAWSTTLPRGRNAALAGVIASLALAVISVHFELWEAHRNSHGNAPTVWAETLTAFNLTTFILLIAVPIMIAAFAVIMEGFRDRFADNHASAKDHGALVGIVLWFIWLLLLFVIMMYDSKLLTYFETADVMPREDSQIKFFGGLTNVLADRHQIFAFIKASMTRPSNYIFPAFTIGTTAAAQLIVREEIKRRNRRYSGHG